MKQKGFLFDADRCIGCQSCRVSCQVHNSTQEAVNWRQVTGHESGSFPDTTRYYLSIACNHCERPACMATCPTGAIIKRSSDGIVRIHADECNGCGRCVGACPYGAPRFNEGRSKVSKCDFCMKRQDAGRLPICVETCVGGALMCGQLNELEKVKKGRYPIRQIDGFFNPEWTRPSIRFLPPKTRI